LLDEHCDAVTIIRTKSTKGSAAETSTAHAAAEELSEQLLWAYLFLEHGASSTTRTAL
jgi:hypothetical protein